MDGLKFVNTRIRQHFKLSVKQSPKSENKKDFIIKIPYASMVRSIIYAMVCSRSNLTFPVSLVRRFMSNPRNLIGMLSRKFFSI